MLLPVLVAMYWRASTRGLVHLHGAGSESDGVDGADGAWRGRLPRLVQGSPIRFAASGKTSKIIEDTPHNMARATSTVLG
ncbi:hypothetical protein V8C26DRAFT_401025 [Trichoderma gracile]